MGRKITIVTGGAGFIGSNIVADLAPRTDVVVSDWLGSDEKWRNLSSHDLADIVAPEQLSDFLEGHKGQVESVIHMGAISSTTETDVDLIMRNNFSLSRDLWRWCGEHQTRFIYASSAATYGDGANGFVDDGHRPALEKLRPLNAYGWSKHLFDRFVARQIEYRALTPPQWVGLKFFNVYGPNEYHKGSMKSVVAQIFPKASQGDDVTLFRSHHPDYEDGGQLRDFVYVKDALAVINWLITNGTVSGLFNLGTGKARSFADLARAVFASLNREAKINYIDTPMEIRDKYQYFTEADMTKLSQAGFRDGFTSLEDGVQDYVQNYLWQDDPYR